MDGVIVGGGIAGFQAAFAFRKLWPEKTVVLIDGEQEVGYYRTLLPQFMVKTIEEKNLFFWKPEDDPSLRVQSGVRVGSLDRKSRRLFLQNNESISYERLVLATGGRPIEPAISPGRSCKGIFAVRYLSTTREIRNWIPHHRRIVVLGGGLVGVKTAAHMAHAGFSVTLLEKEDHLLPGAVSSDAALPVEAHLRKMGIQLLLGCTVEAVQPTEGELAKVRADGKWLPCETLLFAIGSTPDIKFLDGTGLLEDGSLVVSANLQTRDEKIFAVGDAITIQKERPCTPWTWPQAAFQGKLAADNLYRPAPLPLKVFTRVNALSLFGLSLIILGVRPSGAEAVTYSKPEDGVHREIHIMDDRVVGGVLVGDITGAGRLHAMMISEKEIKTAGPQLLNPHFRAVPQQAWADNFNQHRSALFVP